MKNASNVKKINRKTTRSQPGIPIPDTKGTARLLMQMIELGLLAGLQTESAHLVIAGKEPRFLKLPILPGLAVSRSLGFTPGSRRAGKLRDHWIKGLYGFGFIYVVRGEADLLLCRQVVNCHAGNVVFLLPKTWRNQGNASHWERPEIEQADSDILWAFCTQDGVHIHFCKSRGVQHARSPVLFIPDRTIFTLTELFNKEISSGEITAAATQFLWLIFERAWRKLHKEQVIPAEQFVPSSPTNVGLQSKSLGELAQNYIEDNLGEKLTLAIVARGIHVSRTKLAQEFVIHAGETFGVYLLRRRLEQAQLYLKTTKEPIEGISWMCGFSNPHYFSTVFRRHVGMTPTQFRTLQKKNDK